ncbi:N-acetylneuraminate synthase family protein [Herbaspirillum frisingense]|uniref:N-acetylneuraminate synthase family protein n=1 Tax=Herbaspirillum frisingense TaxID=92645 RepID=UPI0039AECA8A
MNYQTDITINGARIGLAHPVYFVADIAANHDGDLERAKDLIWKAKEAGADAAKFQHFKADKIVSDAGFRNLGSQQSHQASWGKSVFEVYRDYEFRREWNSELIDTAKKAGITFMTTPYDVEAVDTLDAFLPAYKIGSGDITWPQFIEYVAKRGKPIMIASGASSMEDVERAVQATLRHNAQIVLMQCNTNYTGSLENFRFINLNVLKTYSARYPGMILGLSDHSPGHATVLGAVALGARVVEKHFTDDCSRVGPDHGFSMSPATWSEMVQRTRELEAALGDGIKRVEDNERQTVVLQQRCIRFTRDLDAGALLTVDDLEILRPAPVDALRPHELENALGRRLATAGKAGSHLTSAHLA